MTNNDLYDFGLRIVRLIENDDLYVKALIKKDDEIEKLREERSRLREALDKICNGPRDVNLSYAELFAELKIEARTALKEEK